MKNRPNITQESEIDSAGFIRDRKHRDTRELNEDTIEAVRVWVREYCRATKSFRSPFHSYGWKHEAERPHEGGGIGRYVSNGEFIVACLREGYRVRQTDHGSPNADLNITWVPQRKAVRS